MEINFFGRSENYRPPAGGGGEDLGKWQVGEEGEAKKGTSSKLDQTRWSCGRGERGGGGGGSGGGKKKRVLSLC